MDTSDDCNQTNQDDRIKSKIKHESTISYLRQIRTPLSDKERTNSTSSEELPWDSNDEFVYDSNYELFYETDDELFKATNTKTTDTCIPSMTPKQDVCDLQVAQGSSILPLLPASSHSITNINADHISMEKLPTPNQNDILKGKGIESKHLSQPINPQETFVIDLTDVKTMENNNLHHSTKQKSENLQFDHAVKVVQKNSTSSNQKLNDRTHRLTKKEAINKETNVSAKNFHVCPVCKRQYASEGNLKCHMRLHQGTLFACTICNKQFIRESYLQRHMKTHDATTRIQCEICGQRLTTESKLKIHKSRHKNKQILNKSYCGKCNRPFSTRTKSHSQHTCQYPYRCTICNRHYRMEQNYNNHMRIHIPDQCHVCTICNKQYHTYRYFENHLCTHEMEGHTCDIKECIARNLYNTGKEIYFTCKTCQRIFTERRDLIDHISAHGTADPQYCRICIIYYGRDMTRQNKCLFCEKQYGTSSALREHLNKHTREDLFKCPICNKIYLRRYTLSQHLKIHKRYLEDICTICNQSFDDKQKLDEHFDIHCTEIIRMHRNEKTTHNCQICNRSFPTFNFMCDHIQKHFPIH